MSDWAPPPGADRVPTLTEVVDLLPPAVPEEASTDAAAADTPGTPVPADLAVMTHGAEPGAGGGAGQASAWGPVPEPALAVDLQALVALSLAELQPRLEMLLESRLREALAPALARAAEVLIGDARAELAKALNELVQDAVRRALQRQGGRAPGADTVPPHRP